MDEVKYKLDKYEVRYDDIHGLPCAIVDTETGFDIIHVRHSERTMENIEEFVENINIAEVMEVKIRDNDN